MKNWRNPNTENTYMKIKQIAEDLRAMAQRLEIVIVSATQLSRCLTLDTKVIHEKYGEIEIKDLKIGDKILSDDGYVSVLYKYPIEKQKVLKIKLKSGKEIKCSAAHRFPTKTGLMLASDLIVGNKLLTVE